MKIMKKVVCLLVFITLFALEFFAISQVRAESMTIENSTSFFDSGYAGRGAAFDAAINEETNNAEVMTKFSLEQTIMSVSELGIGIRGNEKTIAELNKNMGKSLLGQGTQLISAMYLNPVTNTAEYLAWVSNRAGLIPETYAQGLTYSRLLPILPIWKAFRDIAYILLTLIMLLIGLMIAFRSKVNPQTVANVENTIPKVVVTIILITLSYPIAALIIDFMYVIIAAGIGVIGKAVNDPNIDQAIKSYTTGGFSTLFGKTMAPAVQFGGMSGTAGTVSNIAGPVALLGIPLLATPVGAPLIIIGGIIWALAGVSSGASSGDAGAAIMTLASPILVLLIAIVLLFSVFKIFFMLLASYIQILISVIFAPLLLLFNAVPGKNSFTYWWKSIVFHMLSFVVTAIMLYLAWAVASLIQNQAFWTPPFIMQGAGASQAAIGLISLGIVLLIPQMIAQLKQAMGVKSIFQAGPGMVIAPITGGLTQASGIMGQFHTTQQVYNWWKDRKKVKTP